MSIFKIVAVSVLVLTLSVSSSFAQEKCKNGEKESDCHGKKGMFMCNMDDPMQGCFMMGMGINMLCHKLPNLTDAQKIQLKELSEKIKKEMTPLNEKCMIICKEFHNLLLSDESDAVISLKSDEMFQAKASVFKTLLSHRAEFLNILTQEQKDFIKNKLGKMECKMEKKSGCCSKE